MECLVCHAKLSVMSYTHIDTEKHNKIYYKLLKDKDKILNLILNETVKEEIERLIIEYNILVNKYTQCKEYDNFILYGTPSPLTSFTN